ncbi:MAG: hypothetical protein GTN74_05120 [Proteobacteria bacterium]|nr:hypothetical protein [Pseudomonadota bacterium]
MDKIWENEKNGTKYWVLEIGGEKYSVWDSKYIHDVQEGATVEYQWRKSGNFKKITEITPIDNPVKGEAEGAETQTQIRRMGCLKYAAELVAPLPSSAIDKARDVLNMAKAFESYVQEGEVPEKYRGYPWEKNNPESIQR